MDLCELKEKQMASLGPIPFLRDFLCTFNTTCYNKTQIDWSGNNSDNSEIFLQNITYIYNALSNSSSIFLIDRERVTYTMSYLNNTISPLLVAMRQVQSGNQTEVAKGMNTIEASICGSSENDMNILVKNFMTPQREKRSIQSCQNQLQKSLGSSTFGSQIYQVIAPVIFGKIYYTPDSPFTRELTKRANSTFKILDDLRLAAVEWRLHFSYWFVDFMNTSQSINSMRNFCKLNISTFEQMCKSFNSVLDMKNIVELNAAISAGFSLIENLLNCTELDKFVPVKSSIDIENLSTQSLINIYAGLVINESFQYLTTKNATFLSYQIRMPTNRIDTTLKFKTVDSFWTPAPRISTLTDFKYYTSGFMLLQEALDYAFIEMVSSSSNNETVSVGSSMQIMPYPCYVNDKFIKFLSSMIPFLLIIAWAPSVTILLKGIVYEKENRLKEFMQVMGLSNLVHWIGWFITTIVILLCPIILMTLILRFSTILAFSSPAVVFLILLSYVISFICQSFMISVFFDKANVASVAGGIIYFVSYLPFLVFINLPDDMTDSIYYGTGILTQVSFCNAINFIAFWEQSTDGVQFSNLFESTVVNLNIGVGHCMIMMWIDSIIYLLITWYVEAVFPGQYGVAKPWYFLFTRHYWCSKDSCSDKIQITPIVNYSFEPDIDESLLKQHFEAEPKHLEIGISIKNLVKTYPGAKTRAVDNLNLNFYQSQITAFLGHNGAGKTTTISILTGIFSPSSGTAYILNKDIRSDMGKIRRKMGLCPQHNILFSNLTVEDHIYFYGLLKGMKNEEIKKILPKIVEDVGLTKKMKSFSKSLSGGMKRKLSVAMAFIGDSQVVFLDEPTAGVDPFARRGIWDLLIKYKSDDRTIILTTHHMDEADYLSDRIAIISQGKLQCCGSSVFLKKKIGDGYYLILVKNFKAQEEDFHDGISMSGEKILNFIQRHIKDAKMMEETRTQWTFVLPQNDINSCKFSNLFSDLDQNLNNLNIISYGLSDTSLEEVFLKVADDPSGSPEEIKNKLLTSENLDSLTDNGDFPRPSSRLSFRDKPEFSILKDLNTPSCESSPTYSLLSGFSLLRQQLLGLQIKRFHYTKRNIKGFIAELVLPIILIIIMIAFSKISSNLTYQPPMEISPWLMMPKARSVNLNTFYRKENISNILIDKLENGYRSDLSEAGTRCMTPSIYQLENYPCSSANNNNQWSGNPIEPIPLVTPDCDCNKTGYQQCLDSRSGGPQNSYRIMSSTDKLNNLTGYNISDHLMKKFKVYIKKQYGGFQFLLPSSFGLVSKGIGKLPIWDGLRSQINSSNTSNLQPLQFINYFQEFFNLSGVKTNFTRIWTNSKGYASLPAYGNIFSNLLLRTRVDSNPSNYGISVTNYPLKYTQSDLLNKLNGQMFIEVSLAIFVIFGLSFIPASFVIFLIEERVSGSKRQQFVSGVNPYVYWMSNFLWDIIKYILPIFIIVLIFVAFDYQSYIGSKNIGAFIVLLIFYGLAIIPHMYPFSFVLSTPSTAFVVLDAYNLLIGSITTISTFFLDILQEDDDSLKSVNNVLKKVFLVFPQYDLGRGMMDLSFNYLKFNISNGKQSYEPLDWSTTGEKLCSLSVLFVFWWIIVIIIESGIINRFLFGKLKNLNLKNKEIQRIEDNDVALERNRINSEQMTDVLKVINLTKIYNPSLNLKNNCCKKVVKDVLENEKRKLAVNNLCFGVKEGECFGLLGVNGAGKTTTFKMLTGEEEITHGNAFINDYSIINDMIGAHRNMGFCPQFDALHSLLTCEEQLYFYCRIRGIESSQIKSVVDTSLKNLSLTPHTSKMTQNLSGGNKRKLSTAIALIGNPKVIFLDEPTSGMDAGARRFLWNVIQKMTNENKIAVILTSHNMEECEVLCHRLSIMVNGEMKCLGSVQHLKSKFGDDYYVTIRMYSGQDHSNDNEKIKDIILKKFSSEVSFVDENSVILQYRFDSSKKLSLVFDFFENLKIKKIILDYSISQTTLDDVFINFARDDKPDKNVVQNLSDEKNDNGIINKGFDNKTSFA